MSGILKTEDFLAAIHAVKFTTKEQYRKQINAICKREIEFLRAHVELTTLRRYITDLRNAVRREYAVREIPLACHDKKNHGKETHIAVKYLVLTRGETQAYAKHEETRKAVFLDIDGGRPTIVTDYQAMIETAITLLDSERIFETAVGVLALTGRRCIEVMKTGRFEVVSPDHVVFYGQAKTKNPDGGKSKNGYKIPVLGPSEKITAALNRIRLEKDFSLLDERAVNNRTSVMLGRYTKRHFAKHTPGHDIEAKDLRSIYVHVAFESLGYSQRTTINEFASVVLGHADFVTSRNYMAFRLGE